jgi:hypothetical protein
MAFADVDPGTFFVAWVLAAAAAIAVFLHADKNGSRHATAWGIGTFLFLGVVAPIYVIRHRLRQRRRRF